MTLYILDLSREFDDCHSETQLTPSGSVSVILNRTSASNRKYGDCRELESSRLINAVTGKVGLGIDV